MESRPIPISIATLAPKTIEEFELMSHPFGWKAEYYNGQAHFTPRENHVYSRLTLEHREINESINIVPVDQIFQKQIIEVFYETFLDSVEFCNWPTESIRNQVNKNINNYFQGVRGDPLPVSMMAMEPNTEQIIGIALFVQKKEGDTELDLLFVKPSHQRRGIATQMVTKAANILYKNGVRELRCAHHICNEQSRDWQHKYGFEIIPDQFYCRLKYSFYRHEVWRHEKLVAIADGANEVIDRNNSFSSKNLEELRQERDRWYEQIKDDWN
jgi:GNAT superfamily N-acetyltransferase